MKRHIPEGTTVSECLAYSEASVRNLYRKARRSLQTGKPLTLTPTNVAILAGRSLTAIRRAEQLLGLPVLPDR